MLKMLKFNGISNSLYKSNNSLLKYISLNYFSTTNENDMGIKSPGLSKSGSAEEKIIGKSEKHKMKFKNKADKEARAKLLRQEITSNPEFFNAFPHLKEKLTSEEVEDPADDISDHIRKNYVIDEEKGIPDILEKRSNYFESMLGKRKGYENAFKSEQEIELASKKEFVDGFHDPKGPMKYMPRAEKEKIHQEIDKKMQEIEDSGLSREEILFNKPEGIPLKQDKFFQFVKTNKVAREMLVKPNESFSADLVLEKALKQDIGPDASLALKRKNFKLKEDLPLNYELAKYAELYNAKKPNEMLNSDDYDYKEGYTEKLKLHLNSERTRPVSFVNPPLTRGQMRRKFMITTIQPKDIHWRNLPLLTRFLNEGGKLMNKYQTRLPTRLHKKLARTVKHARNMGLLPFIDFVKPYHKLPFTTLYNEFSEDISKVVDVKTGMIKVIHKPSDTDKLSYSSYNSATDANDSFIASQENDKFKNSLLLDRSETPFIPNLEQRDLLMAQNYLIKSNLGKNSAEQTKIMKYDPDSLLNKQEEEAYKRVYDLVSAKVSPSQLIDGFISEKSYDLDNIKHASDRELINIKDSSLKGMKGVRNIKTELRSTVDQINKFIMEHKIDQLKSVSYEKEMKKFKSYKIESDMSQRQLIKKRNVTFKKYKS